MENHDTAKVLCHANLIRPRLAETLLKMPGDFMATRLAPFMLRTILEDSDDMENLERWLSYNGRRDLQIITEILRNISEKSASRVLGSLQNIRSVSDIIGWTKRWSVRLLSKYKFPPPPFLEAGALTPLASAQDMIRECKEMNNCLDTLIKDVLAGHSYFYSWRGSERATVMLNRFPELGWMPTEALGKSNKPVCSSTELEIREAISNQIKRISPS